MLNKYKMIKKNEIYKIQKNLWDETSTARRVGRKWKKIGVRIRWKNVIHEKTFIISPFNETESVTNEFFRSLLAVDCVISLFQ